MATGYKIPDEPEPNALTRLTSDPDVIVTAGMMGGNWLAAPWFAFNAYAVGSATRRREYACAALLPVVTIAGGMLLLFVIERFGLPARVLNYGALAVFALKFALLYELQRMQSVSVGIHRYLGRSVLTGWPLVVVGYLARGAVIDLAFGVSPWLGWAVV